MVRRLHCLSGHESERTPGDGDGQGRLGCCSPWGGKESDTTERLNNNNKEEWGKKKKKNEAITQASVRMNLENIMPDESTQSQHNTQAVCFFT